VAVEVWSIVLVCTLEGVGISLRGGAEQLVGWILLSDLVYGVQEW